MSSDVYSIIRKSKADFVQVNFSDVISRKISLENKEVKDFSKIFAESVSVSAWLGKKQGIATSTKFSNELLEKAIKIAKVSEELEFFYGLPSVKKVHSIKRLCSGEKTEEEIIHSAKGLIPNLKKNEFIPKAELEYSTFRRRIINSEGTDLEEKGSLFNASIESLIKDKEPISYLESLSSKKFPSKNEIITFSERVLEETRELRNPVQLKTFPETVILSHNALAQLLQHAFISNFNGMNVLKKRSCLNEKQGQKMFSEKFNLLDSGILEGGVESQSFDDEGTPSKENLLIKNGVVKDFIYDYNTARHVGKKSTGNSVVGGIGFNNLIIPKGKGIPLDNSLLIKEIIGAHTCNETTTEFSVKSFGALLLNKGQKKAVKDVMVHGRILDILNRIVAIGNKIKNVGEFYLPEIAFNGIKVEKI